MNISNPIYPCLWFDDNSKEVADFYCSIFPNSKIISVTPFVVIFQIKGTKFMCFNGGPEFKFNESISFVINCDTQNEIDFYWQKLSDGGKEGKCGWVQDKFGVSWQIVPSAMSKLMHDPEKAPKVLYQLMQMKKINIDKLLNA